MLDIATSLKPSQRGELEITDINIDYLNRGQLHVEVMGRGFAWLDTGTHTSLLQASQFVEVLEQRQGLRLSCPEEIAFRLGYISLENLCALAKRTGASGYGEYLMSIYQSSKDTVRAPA